MNVLLLAAVINVAVLAVNVDNILITVKTVGMLYDLAGTGVTVGMLLFVSAVGINHGTAVCGSVISVPSSLYVDISAASPVDLTVYGIGGSARGRAALRSTNPLPAAFNVGMLKEGAGAFGRVSMLGLRADKAVCGVLLVHLLGANELRVASIRMDMLESADVIVAITSVRVTYRDRAFTRCSYGDLIIVSRIINVYNGGAVTLYEHVFVRSYLVEGEVLLVVYSVNLRDDIPSADESARKSTEAADMSPIGIFVIVGVFLPEYHCIGSLRGHPACSVFEICRRYCYRRSLGK